LLLSLFCNERLLSERERFFMASAKISLRQDEFQEIDRVAHL
jgi:hypothetical protein